jgi:hypothetical protein
MNLNLVTSLGSTDKTAPTVGLFDASKSLVNKLPGIILNLSRVASDPSIRPILSPSVAPPRRADRMYFSIEQISLNSVADRTLDSWV